MTQLFLTPVDVWLFRDGRPFTAEDDHRAESMFPPLPSVIQGAIRSKHLVVKNIDLTDPAAIEQAVGTTYEYGDLHIRGPFLAREENGQLIRYFPLPVDAVSNPKKAQHIRRASAPQQAPATALSSQEGLLLGLENPPGKAEAGLWLSEEKLHRYFADDEVVATKSSDLFDIEVQPGNRIEFGQGVTAEGALYEIAYIRPKTGVGLNIDLEGYEWPWTGTLSLGGESRAAHYREASYTPPKPAIPAKIPLRFMVYFATPAYFEAGWQPAGWGDFFDGGVELKAAAIGRYQNIGGNDYSKNGHERHKSSRRFVPAGSVYYFEAAREPRLKQIEGLSDFGAQIGFGQIVIPQEGW